MRREFRSQIGAFPPGEPQLVRLNPRIRTADHFKLQVSDDIDQPNWRFLAKVNGAIAATRLLTAKECEQYSSLRFWPGGELARQLQHSRDAGGIIVSAVIYAVTIHWLADTEMVEMRGEQDCLRFQR